VATIIITGPPTKCLRIRKDGIRLLKCKNVNRKKKTTPPQKKQESTGGKEKRLEPNFLKRKRNPVL